MTNEKADLAVALCVVHSYDLQVNVLNTPVDENLFCKVQQIWVSIFFDRIRIKVPEKNPDLDQISFKQIQNKWKTDEESFSD